MKRKKKAVKKRRVKAKKIRNRKRKAPLKAKLSDNKPQTPIFIDPIADVPKTIIEQVRQQFLQDVIRQPNAKIGTKTKLEDFCLDKRFKKEFIEMFLYRTQDIFGISIRRLVNEPIVSILDYIRDFKFKAAKFNWKTN